jgi:microcystin degradation protein MlrC
MPVMALAKRPLLVTPTVTRTTDGPFRPIALEARRMEKDGEVIHAALFPVQPWLDVPDLGFAALVCAEDQTSATTAAEKLADLMWAHRADFFPDLAPLDEAIRIGLTSDGMTLVADAGDAPTGGSAADSPAVLAALIAGGADKSERLSYLTLCDPPAVETAMKAGLGKPVSLSVGHHFSRNDGRPVAITGTVRHLSDGRYTMTDGGPNGMELRMGPSAVIGIGGIRLLLRSQPSMEWDKAMYESQSLPLRDAALAFVKSPSHFRQSFGPLATRILVANTPGPTAPDMTRIPFTKVTRPLYPLDSL